MKLTLPPIEIDEGEVGWVVESSIAFADIDLGSVIFAEEALKEVVDPLKGKPVYNEDRSKVVGRVIDAEYNPEKKAIWLRYRLVKILRNDCRERR